MGGCVGEFGFLFTSRNFLHDANTVITPNNRIYFTINFMIGDLEVEVNAEEVAADGGISEPGECVHITACA